MKRTRAALAAFREIDDRLEQVQNGNDLANWSVARVDAARKVAEAFADETADVNPNREATIKHVLFAVTTNDPWVARAIEDCEVHQ